MRGIQQKGIWELRAPDGTIFKAESPLNCCRQEVNLRIPLKERIENLTTAMDLCFLCEEDKADYILAKGTPAEIAVCGTCKNTILQHSIYSKSKNEIVLPHTIKIF